MISLFRRVKRKGWFIFDLPFFIRENKFQKGIEIGAKAGMSMYFILKINRNLHLTGIDLWKVIQGGAYRNNSKNEINVKKN